jgi:putative two-component system response regulator
MNQAKTPVGAGLVLVVDDSEANLKLLTMALDGAADIMVASNGREALEAVAMERPDLIVLDIRMPEMDGYQVCTALKRDPHTRDIPVIFVSGLSDIDDKARGFALGAVDFIGKPFDIAEVRMRVTTQLHLKQAMAALSRSNEDLELRVRQRTSDLQQALDRYRKSSIDTIFRLSKAAEYKDDDTGAHVIRMAYFSRIIARTMGLPGEMVDGLFYAAPMHDVGKIGIPDRILGKKGKLDEEEWRVMKLHPIIGSRILEKGDSELIALAEIIAISHHEKWDGSGYPYRLGGADIPLVGRIVAVADVFDAVTSQRPYKEAMSLQDALKIIEEGRGKHFDPAVVEAFFAAMDEIITIKKSYSDQSAQSFPTPDPALPCAVKGEFQ